MMGEMGVYIVIMARSFANGFWKVFATISPNMSGQTNLMVDYHSKSRSKCIHMPVLT
jgi:hypothetical protein